MSIKEDFKVTNIRETVKILENRIVELKKTGLTDPFDFEMDIMSYMPEFYNEYPFLVKRITSGQDTNYLYKMLDTLDKVQAGNTSFASAELKLGDELANEFLYPAINKDNK